VKKHIFYHVFPRFNWCDLVQEQLSKVIESGLYEEIESLTIILLSDNKQNESWLRRITSKFKKISIIIEADGMVAERRTLSIINDFAKKALRANCSRTLE
jgi:hypothetical protein